MPSNSIIYIVDDNLEMSKAMRFLFESEQYTVRTYARADLFLNSEEEKKQGCILIDVRMPGMSGLELLEHFKKREIYLPVIMVTAYADIAMVVRAMKAGAKDFILKPFNNQELLDSVKQCIEKANQMHTLQQYKKYMKLLTEQEHQIVQLILDGYLNKQIADKLSMSISTIEVHRASIMKKMNANSLAHLIKIFLFAQPHGLY